MASSQEVDRDRSKYAVNNFADDDIYTMYEPYATVKVNEPGGRKVKNIILMIGDGMGLEQISAAPVLGVIPSFAQGQKSEYAYERDLNGKAVKK